MQIKRFLENKNKFLLFKEFITSGIWTDCLKPYFIDKISEYKDIDKLDGANIDRSYWKSKVKLDFLRELVKDMDSVKDIRSYEEIINK